MPETPKNPAEPDETAPPSPEGGRAEGAKKKPAPEVMTLLDVLIRKFPKSTRTTLRKMLVDRRIFVAKRLARSMKQPVAPGETVEIRPARSPGAPLSPAPKPAPRKTGEAPRASVRPTVPAGGRLPFDIIYEDEDILVINKPPGLLTSTTPRETRPTVAAYLRAYLLHNDPRARMGIIHRLDRDASGLLVFSRNNAAYESLKFQLKKRTVERTYLALVDAKTGEKSGTIRSRLIEIADGRVRSNHRDNTGEPAVTRFELLRKGARSLLRVRLETGRKHQIRVHMAERGWPIVGDVLYNPKRSDEPLRLLAAALALAHPRTHAPMRWELPIPDWAEPPKT